MQRDRRITIDSDGPAGDTQAEEASGTFTPFTHSLPFHTSSQLQTPLTKSSSTVFPPTTKPHTPDQPSAGVRDNSDRTDTLVEMMQHIQERLLHIEGHLTAERVQDRERTGQRHQRMSTAQSGEDTSETLSDDRPPTYSK